MYDILTWQLSLAPADLIVWLSMFFCFLSSENISTQPLSKRTIGIMDVLSPSVSPRYHIPALWLCVLGPGQVTSVNT